MENDSPQDVSNAIMARGDVLKGFPETENTKKLKTDSVNKVRAFACLLIYSVNVLQCSK